MNKIVSFKYQNGKTEYLGELNFQDIIRQLENNGEIFQHTEDDMRYFNDINGNEVIDNYDADRLVGGVFFSNNYIVYSKYLINCDKEELLKIDENNIN